LDVGNKSSRSAVVPTLSETLGQSFIFETTNLWPYWIARTFDKT